MPALVVLFGFGFHDPLGRLKGEENGIGRSACNGCGVVVSGWGYIVGLVESIQLFVGVTEAYVTRYLNT